MKDGNNILGFRVSYVLCSMVTTTLPGECYSVTVIALRKNNLVVTLPPKIYTHNIEIATHWLLDVYLVATIRTKIHKLLLSK